MEECPICFEPCEKGYVVTGCCQKRMHITCYTACMNVNTACPLCRGSTRDEESLVETLHQTHVVVLNYKPFLYSFVGFFVAGVFVFNLLHNPFGWLFQCRQECQWINSWGTDNLEPTWRFNLNLPQKTFFEINQVWIVLSKLVRHVKESRYGGFHKLEMWQCLIWIFSVLVLDHHLLVPVISFSNYVVPWALAKVKNHLQTKWTSEAVSTWPREPEVR